jgi:hypothetical protein
MTEGQADLFPIAVLALLVVFVLCVVVGLFGFRP